MSTVIVLVLLNFLLGLAMFEWSWVKSTRVRQVVESRDNLFPAWRRNDVSNWSKLKMYPVALTIMPLRICVFLILLLSTYVGTRIIFWRTELIGNIPENIKRKQEEFLAKMARLMLRFVFFVIPQYKPNQLKFDYSYYLGTSDFPKQDCSKNIPTVVINHTTGIDALIAIAHFNGKVCF